MVCRALPPVATTALQAAAPQHLPGTQTAFSTPARAISGTSQPRSRRPRVTGPARTGRGPLFPTGQTWSACTEPSTQREKCIQDWQDLLAQIGSCSITFVAAAASHFEASLRAYTPSTIAQYFRRIRAFLAFIGALSFGVENLLLVHLVDLLHACENSKMEDRSSVRIAPPPMLKALSWLARIGQIESLASLLSNPLAKAFASPQQPQALGCQTCWSSISLAWVLRTLQISLTLTPMHPISASCWTACLLKRGPPWESRIQSTQYLRHTLGGPLSWPRHPPPKNPCFARSADIARNRWETLDAVLRESLSKYFEKLEGTTLHQPLQIWTDRVVMTSPYDAILNTKTHFTGFMQLVKKGKPPVLFPPFAGT